VDDGSLLADSAKLGLAATQRRVRINQIQQVNSWNDCVMMTEQQTLGACPCFQSKMAGSSSDIYSRATAKSRYGLVHRMTGENWEKKFCNKECTNNPNWLSTISFHPNSNKKLSYRRGTARRAMSVQTMLNVAQMFVELHLISPALGEWPPRSLQMARIDRPYDSSY